MARLPKWLRVGRTTAAPAARTVTVTLFADTARFVASMQRAAIATEQFADSIRRIMFKIELAHIRMETKWFIRGGLEQAYADPAARDAQIKELVAIPIFGPRAAAAFIRGWVDTYGQGDREPYVRHMLIGDTMVKVSAA